jgi:hypothetical protein
MSTIPTFGSFGVVRQSDFHNTKTQRSFQAWLQEVKAIPSFTGPKWELQDYFKEFMEDFNTATFPHVKYYNYDQWELDEYEKNKARMAGGGGTNTAQRDEARHAQDLYDRAKQKRLDEDKMVRQMMSKSKMEEMKHKQQLQSEMAHAFKLGDTETYKRLKKKLEPEEKIIK